MTASELKGEKRKGNEGGKRKEKEKKKQLPKLTSIGNAEKHESGITYKRSIEDEMLA